MIYSAPHAFTHVAAISVFLAGTVLFAPMTFATVATTNTLTTPSRYAPRPGIADATAPDGAEPDDAAAEPGIEPTEVFSPINAAVKSHLTAFPQVQAPLDTLKIQIYNRMNGGLLSGKLTNDEMDEMQLMMDKFQHQESEFKLGGCGLSPGAVNNLMRKYYMVDQRLTELLDNGDYVTYMPNIEMRRSGLQRRVQFHVADGNLTPSEGEQLLTALNTFSDLYANAQATGNVVTGSELESLHRDLFAIQGQMAERTNGCIAFTIPGTQDKLQTLRKTIASAVASQRFTDEERCQIIEEFNELQKLQNSIIAYEGLTSPELRLVAKEIDGLNFVLTRELRDRQTACRDIHM
jgi:hypothetical protein